MKEFEYQNKIMGCDLSISIVGETKREVQYFFDQIYSDLKNYESVFSRFDDSSELSLLNEKKSLSVSDLFWEVFLEAEKMYFESKGLFNPLSQISQFGYKKDFSNKDSFVKNKEISYNDDFSKIILKRDTKYIQLSKDQKLDFGGFLKGYLAQKLSKKIEHFHGSIINIGGDIYAQGLDEGGKIFAFDIFDPILNIEAIDVSFQGKALSTSGTYHRKWKNLEENFSHIINPKNKQVTQSDLVSASVISSRGSESDAFATLAIILGSSGSIDFFKGKNINYFLITKSGEYIHNLKTT